MTQFETHKATATGKAQTLNRRAVRAVKYSTAAKLTRSARPALALAKGATK